MSRTVTIAAAQMGPVARDESRPEVVARLVALLQQGAAMGAELVVFPELALTTFFPRWYITDPAELDAWFEPAMPSPATQPLFDEAARLGVGFSLGFAELTPEGGHFNTQVLVGPDGGEVGRYRKVHLPGHADHEPWRRFQHLEKRYFDVGDTGFRTWKAFDGVIGMMICNDRRWPESYRMLALQGAELILCGYNTPVHNPPAPEHDVLGDFHNHLVLQAGAYQNGCWVVGVAKAGDEEGVPMIGGSCIVAPSGEIVARCTTVADEVAVARCDLDRCASYTRTTFNFGVHRQIEAYGLITSQRGVVSP